MVLQRRIRYEAHYGICIIAVYANPWSIYTEFMETGYGADWFKGGQGIESLKHTSSCFKRYTTYYEYTGADEL